MRHLIMLISMVVACAISARVQSEEPKNAQLSFEDAAAGALPSGWKAEGTQQEGPVATWAVQEDASAPDGKNVLTLTKPNHRSSSTFNICWTDSVQFKDGDLSVKVRANAGNVDEGGGPIWRVKDKDNYYICRANPLEDNIRLYYVKGGKRTQLDSATVTIPAEQWHEIRVTQRGTKIECYLNGKKMLEADDATFPEAGGVGVWTKADAATSFDAFSVQSATEPTPK